MRKQNIAAAVLAGLLCALAGSAQTQSAADLLQKGIHAQETVGDVDSAIQIFRQVATGSNRLLASQAQYQLVLCMLQKGDRSAAVKELDELKQKFADQAELVSKASKLIGSDPGLLPAPWPSHESLQLNIKRGGVYTGGYLFYSVSPVSKESSGPSANPNDYSVVWELDTATSSHQVSTVVSRETMREVGRHYQETDDDLGDRAVLPFIGPATDFEQSVFLMRRLPLAVGYTTSLPITSWTAAPTSARYRSCWDTRRCPRRRCTPTWAWTS
jgi:hypothetical protein